MSFDPQKEEQKAIGFMNQGKTEDALRSYKVLLRKDPRNRRLRKQVSDLLLNLGNKREAEQMLLSIAETDVKERQYRRAIPIYRELINMRPKDHELHLEISECLVAENFESEALVHLRKAVEMTRRLKPEVAQSIQHKVITYAPGDLAERRTFAELLESASWTDKASDAWKSFAEINRKVGKPKEAARSIERSLQLRDSWEVRVEAAQARFESNEPRKALEHLQQVYKEVRNEPKILALLATGLSMVGHDAQARQLWLEAAKRYDDVVRTAAALEEAQNCGASEEELGEGFQDVFHQARAVQMRLHTTPWATPKTKVELRYVIKARLFLEFNRPSDALDVLFAAEGLESRPSIFAHLIESMILLGQEEQAIELLQDFQSSDETINHDVHLRLLGLGLEDEDSDELIDDDLLDDDLEEMISDSEEESSNNEEDTIEQTLQLAEQAKDSGNLDEAFNLLNQVLELDSSNLIAIEKMSTWAALEFSNDPAPEEVVTETFSLPQNPTAFATPSNPFAAPESNPFSQNPTRLSSGPLHLRSEFTQVFQYQLIGFFKQSEELLTSDKSLEAGVLLARQWIQQDKLRKAVDELQDRLDTSNKENPTFVLALWEIARAYSLQQRVRSTLRTLDEIELVDPTFKTAEIQLWRKALQLLD